jgi:hypothetical protein
MYHPAFLKPFFPVIPERFPVSSSIGIQLALHHTEISPAD